MTDAGNIGSAKILLSYFPKPKGQNVCLENMPPITKMADIPAYLKALFDKLNTGDIDVQSFDIMTRALSRLTDSLDAVDIDSRLERVQQHVDV